jgi:hypothetical protein
MKTDRLDFETLVEADSRKRFPELFLPQTKDQQPARTTRPTEVGDEQMEVNTDT